jgi:hypothetical protein
MRPLRITLNFDANDVKIEYVNHVAPGLRPEELKELDALTHELKEKNFTDFSKAELFQPEEREDLMVKKKRLEKLREWQSVAREEFVEAQPVKSLFILYRPDQPIDCVSNMPAWMIDKLTQNQVLINVTPANGVQYVAQPTQTQTPTTQPIPQPQVNPLRSGTPNEQKVIAVLAAAKGPWVALGQDPIARDAFDLVDVKEEQPNMVFIRPKKFLKENWAPINQAIKDVWGEQCWKSQGRGDKEAHWLVNLR